mmetsp:Transcript_3781/g.8931  ORF Transcript_3781/g.8931 Transcript_3781/m.8931 type:complete len:334 (-) Transcript_3781:409-1410(-)
MMMTYTGETQKATPNSPPPLSSSSRGSPRATIAVSAPAARASASRPPRGSRGCSAKPTARTRGRQPRTRGLAMTALVMTAAKGAMTAAKVAMTALAMTAAKEAMTAAKVAMTALAMTAAKEVMTAAKVAATIGRGTLPTGLATAPLRGNSAIGSATAGRRTRTEHASPGGPARGLLRRRSKDSTPREGTSGEQAGTTAARRPPWHGPTTGTGPRPTAPTAPRPRRTRPRSSLARAGSSGKEIASHRRRARKRPPRGPPLLLLLLGVLLGGLCRPRSSHWRRTGPCAPPPGLPPVFVQPCPSGFGLWSQQGRRPRRTGPKRKPPEPCASGAQAR